MSRILSGFRRWAGMHPCGIWFYSGCFIITAVLFFTAPINGNGHKWLYLGFFILLFFAFRPSSALHICTVEKDTPRKTLCTVLVALITMAACVLPMGELPLWNGERPDHRNQYELMAEAILEGRVDLVYGDEDSLAELSNPYDPTERNESGARYHWDHAYYNGHYYMYFGVVPVFLVFLPFRLLTGRALTTFRATQIFAVFSIVGIFVLFRLLSKLFFKKLPCSVYLALSVAFSVMSLWYSTVEPALYCTAITSAIALEIWSLYFFIRAVWGEQNENRQIVLAGFGAALGALALGCRPPIALANLLVVPMLITFLKQHKLTGKLLCKLLLASLPYFVVAAALMWYNYIRFDNPFEFGQAYQLTVTDQTHYGLSLNVATFLRIINNTVRSLVEFKDIQSTFPYLNAGGVFFNFPILLLCFGICRFEVLKKMRQSNFLSLMIGFLFTVLIIIAADVLWSPFLLERYHLDIYFLMGIACYITIGFWYNTCTLKQRTYVSFVSSALSIITVTFAFFLCIAVLRENYPDKVIAVANALHLN